MRKGEGPSVEFVRRYVSKNVDIHNVQKNLLILSLKNISPAAHVKYMGLGEVLIFSDLTMLEERLKNIETQLFVLRRKTCTNMGRKSV